MSFHDRVREGGISPLRDRDVAVELIQGAIGKLPRGLTVDPAPVSEHGIVGVEDAWHVALMRVAGRLNLVNVAALRRFLTEAPRTPRCIVLDLAGVPECNTHAAAVLDMTEQHLRSRGTRLGLWRLRSEPRAVLKRGPTASAVVDGELSQWLQHPC